MAESFFLLISVASLHLMYSLTMQINSFIENNCETPAKVIGYISAVKLFH